MIALILAQAAEAPPPLGFYEFVLLLVREPAIVTLLGAVAAILGAIALLIRHYAGRLVAHLAATRAEVAANTALTAAAATELKDVHAKVDGQGEELRAYAERAGRAEGKVEGLQEAAAPVPPVIVVPPLLAPPPRTGAERTRASDRETSAPLDQDAGPPQP